MSGFVSIECTSATHAGLRRMTNHDNHVLCPAQDETEWRTSGHLFVVAHDMGGANAGERARAMAVEALPRWFREHASKGTAAALREAFASTNAAIHEVGRTETRFADLATFATMLALRPDGAWIGHLGRCQVYRIRDGRIARLTLDAYEEILQGFARGLRCTPEEVRGQCIHYHLPTLGGYEPTVRIHVEGPYPLQVGDIFLLCSLGLREVVSDPELGAVFTMLPLTEACAFLIDLANLRGGPNNTTVVVVRVTEVVEASIPEGPTQDAPTPPKVGWPLAALARLADWFRRSKKPPSPSSARIYQEESCAIDCPRVEHLRRASAKLAEWIEPQNWDLDWPRYRRHSNVGESFLARGDFDGAFREHCRAFHVLTRALDSNRDDSTSLAKVWRFLAPLEGWR